MSSDYSFEVLSKIPDIKAKASEIEFFLLNEAMGTFIQQNPYVLLAENRRNPKRKPWAVVIRKEDKIVAYAGGLIDNSPFPLSFSVFHVPGPRLRTLIFTGDTLVFSENCDKHRATHTFLSVLKEAMEYLDIIYLDQNQINPLVFDIIENRKKDTASCFSISRTSNKIEMISWHVLGKNYDDWLNSFNRKSKKRMSWELSRFKSRAPQPLAVQRIIDECQVHRFMESVELIRADMWQTKTFGTSSIALHDNVLFFKTLARRKWLRSYLLTCAGQPVAYELAVQYGDEVIFLERGYIQTLNKIGPGTFLTHFIIRDCYETDPPKKINFGYGENDFKKRLRNKTSDACCAYLTAPNSGRVLVRSQMALSMIELWISDVLVKMKLDQRVRRLLKRK